LSALVQSHNLPSLQAMTQSASLPPQQMAFSHEASGHGSISGTASGSASDSCSQIIPVLFSTPHKLKTVEQVMRDNPGSIVASLGQLTTVLARDAIFGREELSRSSLYIKTLVQSRIPNKSPV
jgi:hypothetical protein